MDRHSLEGYDNPVANHAEMNGSTVQNGHVGQSALDVPATVEEKDKTKKEEEKPKTVGIASMVKTVKKHLNVC